MPTTVASLPMARAVEDLRAEFAAYLQAFDQLSTSRAALAPHFHRTWQRWQRATGGTFVAFVRELDRRVPADKPGYQRHRSYQAALYLRRIAEAPGTQARFRRTVSPYQLLARVTRTLLYAVPERDRDALRVTVAKASGWRGRDLERLWRSVGAAASLPMPGRPRLVRHHQHLARPSASAARSPLAAAADRG